MTATTRRRRTLGAITAALAVPTLLLALAGCAPANSEAGGSSPDAGGTGGAVSELTFTDWQLKYAACMRGEGIDMPDPEGVGGGITIQMSDDMTAFDAANQVCQDELGTPPAISAEERAAADEEFLVWATGVAECYRENGFDVPDPKLGEAPQLPSDAPTEVIEECGGGAVATSTDG